MLLLFLFFFDHTANNLNELKSNECVSLESVCLCVCMLADSVIVYQRSTTVCRETDCNKQFAAACDIWEEVHNCIRVYAEILVKVIKFVVSLSV